MKRIFLALVALAGLWQMPARALPVPACVATGSTPLSSSMSIPTTALYQPFLTLTTTYHVTCTSRTNPVAITYGPSGSVTLVPSTTNVWATGYPGLGVIVSETAPSSTVLSTLVSGQTGTLATLAPGTTSATISLKFELVRTGTITSGSAGTLTLFSPFPLDTVSAQQGSSMQAVSIGLPTFTSSGCSVTTPGVVVNLPKVSRNSFVNSSSAGTTPFSIGLTCQGSTRVLASFNDANNSSNTSSVLGLSSTSTASGVGFELLTQGGAPIVLSSPATPVNTDFGLFSGATSLPMMVRYVQTAGGIVAGSATANAVFTLTYQ